MRLFRRKRRRWKGRGAVEISPRRRILRTFLRNRTAVIGTVIAVCVITVAILAPVIAPYDPIRQNIRSRFSPPQRSYPFGTDFFGRDVLSRVIYGARISLLVGVSSVLLGMVVGTAMGMVAAYFRGKAETLVMRTVDVMMSFPDEVLGIMIMVALGSGLFKLILAIAFLMAPRFARLAYGPTLALRERDYVDAARAAGCGNARILVRHILPNIFGEILVMSTLWTATAIRLEANLSFLGLGVAPPTPTWGNMIRTGLDHLVDAWWVSVFPGAAILITVLAFNMLGDGLRDIADPKLRT